MQPVRQAVCARRHDSLSGCLGLRPLQAAVRPKIERGRGCLRRNGLCRILGTIRRQIFRRLDSRRDQYGAWRGDQYRFIRIRRSRRKRLSRDCHIQSIVSACACRRLHDLFCRQIRRDAGQNGAQAASRHLRWRRSQLRQSAWPIFCRMAERHHVDHRLSDLHLG